MNIFTHRHIFPTCLATDGAHFFVFILPSSKPRAIGFYCATSFLLYTVSARDVLPVYANPSIWYLWERVKKNCVTENDRSRDKWLRTRCFCSALIHRWFIVRIVLSPLIGSVILWSLPNPPHFFCSFVLLASGGNRCWSCYLCLAYGFNRKCITFKLAERRNWNGSCTYGLHMNAQFLLQSRVCFMHHHRGEQRNHRSLNYCNNWHRKMIKPVTHPKLENGKSSQVSTGSSPSRSFHLSTLRGAVIVHIEIHISFSIYSKTYPSLAWCRDYASLGYKQLGK